MRPTCCRTACCGSSVTALNSGRHQAGHRSPPPASPRMTCRRWRDGGTASISALKRQSLGAHRRRHRRRGPGITRAADKAALVALLRREKLLEAGTDEPPIVAVHALIAATPACSRWCKPTTLRARPPPSISPAPIANAPTGAGDWAPRLRHCARAISRGLCWRHSVRQGGDARWQLSYSSHNERPRGEKCRRRYPDRATALGWRCHAVAFACRCRPPTIRN